MAVQSDVMEAAGPYDRARALNAFKLGDVTFYWITRACAISVLLILGGIILSLIVGAWPAIKEYGFSFLVTSRWAPSADPPVLGALGPIYGTLVTSVIAMMIAIPVGIGIAVFLTEICPIWLRRPIGLAVELLAGIPSIIYGMWGFFVLGPFLANSFQPFMIWLFEGWPVLGTIFAPGTTIAAAIASEFAESDGLHQSALILLGLLLFVLTFFVLASARLMLLRLEKKAGN